MTNPPSVSVPAGEEIIQACYELCAGLIHLAFSHPHHSVHFDRADRVRSMIHSLTTRLSALERENGELKAARDQLRASLGIHIQTIGGELSSLPSSSERS